MLFHAFVTSCINYCNSVLALAPKTITDELQRVLNTAAHVISVTAKYDSWFVTKCTGLTFCSGCSTNLQ